MTDKEFKRLSRAQLIEIIYQLQLKQEELMAENEKLSEAVADKRLLVENAGNIAEAALEVHNVMQSAQEAAKHYLEEIRLRVKDERRRILQNAENEAAAIIAAAKGEAAVILGREKYVRFTDETPQNRPSAELPVQKPKEKASYDFVVESILKEYGKNR